MNLTFHTITERKEYWEWISTRAQVLWTEGTQGFVAVDEHGEIHAGVLFDEWTHTACRGHIAIENPFVLRHGFLESAFQYVFDFCKRKMMLGVTPSDNAEALRFNRKCGWREIYRIKDGFNEGVDLVVQQMNREECRWLRRQ